MEKVTIKDIARMCNVSIATVSRALNNSNKGVGQKTKDHILTVIKELNYSPSGIARGMVNGNTGLIGLVLPDIRNPFFAELARGVEDYCTKTHYNCLLCNTDSKPEKEQAYISFFQKRMVSGVIFTAQNSKVRNENLYGFKKSHIPFCLVEYYCNALSDVPAVYFKNKKGARLIVELLIKNNHKNIAFIGGPSSTQNAIDRFEGYKEALAFHNIPFNKKLTIAADYSYVGGYNAIKALFARNISFTAVFTANDLMGYGAMEYIHKKGKKIPDDYSLVGFDNISFPAVFQPVITSVEIPAYRFGKLAAKKVIHCIEKKEVIPLIDVIEPVIVDKGSIKKI
ncbi:LacI family DNA-binding transcriptional regulator [Treponema sp. HNW]|uniref:LacI family DNA-binding transcriptional regulator n=1 Tax=Treponema sp. HNW TaxID=3116654 RepID=UPI003D0DD5E8